LDWAHAAKRDLDQFIAVSPSAVAVGNAAQGIQWTPGDRASLRDLLYAALLQSDNVAAQAIAEYVGRMVEQQSGSDDHVVPFVAQMNALARKLDMNDTRFLNPHGLEGMERRLPYSTAEDMARLTSYAMSNSGFRFIVSQRERRIAVHRLDSSKYDYLLRNTNDALGEFSIDGVKTGTTRQAGQCLAISAARPPEVRQEGETFYPIPRRLEVVILGSQNRFEEAKQLLQAGWGQHQRWVAAGRPIDPKEKSGIKTALGL
jgi:D-alanyl-D-alanine carboxypeptidase